MSDALSQDEINALLGASDNANSLTERQKDILGEVGNISMGTSATTLSTLLNQKVFITTPSVNVMNWKQISQSYDRPCVGVKIDYTMGIKGSNVLILKNTDVKIIADLMMGGSGTDVNGDELNEIDLSAIGEAMNQMIGSSSTSLSSFVNERIDIATPKAIQIDFSNEEFASKLGFEDEAVAVVTFKLTIGNLIDSEIMQVYPMEFAVTITQQLQKIFETSDDNNQESQPEIQSPVQETTPTVQHVQTNIPQNNSNNMSIPTSPHPSQMEGMYMNNMPNTDMAMQNPGMGMPNNMYASHNVNQPQTNVSAKPAQFQSFDTSTVIQQKENIDILMDVPLEVTVELGKTSKRIKEILEFTPGTIIELDKLAGEPIDILVNGKYVAKGEVVVIDENFGIRVTSIINPELRI